MRCNVRVVGIGQRRTGTGKNGRSYDFVPVSIEYMDPNFSGFKADTVNITGDMFVKADVQVNDDLDVVMHEQNFRLQVDAIL